MLKPGNHLFIEKRTNFLFIFFLPKTDLNLISTHFFLRINICKPFHFIGEGLVLKIVKTLEGRKKRRRIRN